MRPRLVAATGLTAAALLPAVLALPTPAQAAWSSFTAVAEADGLRFALHVTGGPLSDDVLDAGSPRAQALLDGLGSSTAFAAAPWPGELVANASGLLAGPTGQQLPSYPMIAASSYPTKAEDDQEVGSVRLSARSAADSSSSRGRDASDGVDTTAGVERTSKGVLIANAKAVVAGFTVGPLVLGRVEATAGAERAVDGSLQRTSTVSVTGARVGTQAVELTPKGMSVLGTGVPLGPQDPVLKPLRDAGITISWVSEQSSPDGVVSPGLEVTVTRPVSLAGEGQSSVRYTVGRAAARVSVSGPALPLSPLPEEALPGGTGTSTIGAPPTPSTTLPAPVLTAAVQPAPAPAAAVGSSEPGGQVLMRRVAEVWPSFYLPLVAAALLTICGALALRSWGVRSVWEP